YLRTQRSGKWSDIRVFQQVLQAKQAKAFHQHGVVMPGVGTMLSDTNGGGINSAKRVTRRQSSPELPVLANAERVIEESDSVDGRTPDHCCGKRKRSHQEDLAQEVGG